MIAKGNDQGQEIVFLIVEIATDVGNVMIVIFVTEIVNVRDPDLEKGLKNVQEAVQEIVLTVDPGANLVIENVVAEIIAGTSIVQANPTIPAMEFCLPWFIQKKLTKTKSKKS